MVSSVPSVRVADAASIPAPSSGGTLFKQAMTQVARIERPLSPALRPDAPSGLGQSPWAAVQQAQSKLTRLQTQMQVTGNARLAPEMAMQMAELDYRATLAAKTLAKTSATVKEIATAA